MSILALPPKEGPRYVQVEESLHLATLPETAHILDAEKADEAGSGPVWALIGYLGQIRRVLYSAQGLPYQDDFLSAAALRAAVTNVPFSTGPLEPNTVLFGSHGGRAGKLVYLPPAVRTMHVQLVEDERSTVLTLTLPLPPLLWLVTWSAVEQSHALFACAGYPRRPRDPLCEAPIFNVAPKGGRICFGTVVLPAPQQITVGSSPLTVDVAQIAEAFFTSSYFTLHYPQGKSKKHPHDLLACWRELAAGPGRRARRYPLGDLVPCGTYGDIVTSFEKGLGT